MQSTLNKIHCYWEYHSGIRSVSHSISFSKCTKHTGLTGEFMYKSRLIQKSCKHPTPDTENPSVSQAAKLNAKKCHLCHAFLPILNIRGKNRVISCWNHRTAWVEKGLKDHLCPTPLQFHVWHQRQMMESRRRKGNIGELWVCFQPCCPEKVEEVTTKNGAEWASMLDLKQELLDGR